MKPQEEVESPGVRVACGTEAHIHEVWETITIKFLLLEVNT